VRYVPADNVPYHPSRTSQSSLSTTQASFSTTTKTRTETPQEIIASVCSDNPIRELNETWSACWDDEAGAVYYYNKSTGEATWIPPDL
jgi:hypothetical protein